MALEVKVVTKPGENILSALFLQSGNWPLYCDMLVKGATPILTVGDLVTLVANTASKKKTTVDFVQINGHGNKGGFDIGNDWIDSKMLPRFNSELSKITPHLSKNAAVEVSACTVGNAKELMRDFSHILGGVATIGYLVSQPGNLARVGQPVIVTRGGHTARWLQRREVHHRHPFLQACEASIQGIIFPPCSSWALLQKRAGS